MCGGIPNGEEGVCAALKFSANPSRAVQPIILFSEMLLLLRHQKQLLFLSI
jgi:hypothetical protein